MAMDEQLAMHMLDHPPPTEAAPRRRVSEWSPELDALTAILDRLGEIGQILAKLGGAKARSVPPAPRPLTAMERVRQRRAVSKHRALVARVLPHVTDEPDRGREEVRHGLRSRDRVPTGDRQLPRDPVGSAWNRP